MEEGQARGDVDGRGRGSSLSLSLSLSLSYYKALISLWVERIRGQSEDS